MNPTVNKSDFEDLTTNLRDLAYSYLEKYSPSKQQLKVFLLKKYLTKKIPLQALRGTNPATPMTASTGWRARKLWSQMVRESILGESSCGLKCH